MQYQALEKQLPPAAASLAGPRVKLGPFDLEHPFILAPMAGITNSPFRRLMRRMKSALVVSELVSANGIEYSGQKTLDLLRYHDEERIVGLQIFGESAERLAKACQYVERLGADFVDLNLGCPVPKVVKNGAGSAMCRDPIALGKTLETMVKSTKLPVTIKIRTGWEQNCRNAIEVVRVAAEAGVHWVAIHGRTRAQGYSGQADWDFIGEIKAKSPIPIIGNGDVVTPEQAMERYRTFGVDAVMVGRGALRNPFLFEQVFALWNGRSYEPPTVERFLKLIEDQKKTLNESFNPKGAMIHARKFLAWYSSGIPGCHEFRKQVFSIPEPEALWEEARAFFSKGVERTDRGYLAQPFLMGGHG
ncbi:MAG TPA: tRNA dihydrouridine synthase DusB [Bdellovibrionota bacterium]|nr:tRNA dihydrouridine synthase DusB [Bdellovibrionota bacterium]